MRKTPEQYLKEPYARLLIPNENGTFTAEMLEFPGCIAEGKTANEAIANLEKAAKGWIQGSLSQKREIPKPVYDYEHSGRVALRLPRSLHREAAQMAERDRTSLNQFLVAAVAVRVGASDLFNRMVQKFMQRNIVTTQNVILITAGNIDQRRVLTDQDNFYYAPMAQQLAGVSYGE